jgi:spermidine synthase
VRGKHDPTVSAKEAVVDQLDSRGAPLSGLLRAAACVASCFASAALMFALEPMLARLLLPTHGGSPAVWNTCVVVFQTLLVLGYLYAHKLVATLPRRRQIAVHGVLLVVSLAFVPPGLFEVAWGSERPVAGIALALLGGAGLPFFVLATNASLSQQWFAWGRSTDPSWLYAASNAGSLAALAGYPFAFDRWFGLREQSRLWSYGYAAFVLLTLGILVTGWKQGRQHERPARALEIALSAPITRARTFDWLARTAVASSLLLSVTLRISSDAGAAPMFWTVPLALYLTTFILAFSPKDRVPRRFVVWGVVLTTSACLAGYLYPFDLAVKIGLHLLVLFFGSWLCHGDVARDRPPAADLSRYFLVIAVGGMVGGIANSLAAPFLFDSVAEFPLTLVALSVCVLRREDFRQVFERQRFRRPQTYVAPVAMGFAVLAALVAVYHQRTSTTQVDPASVFILGAVLLLGVVFLRESGAFQLSIALVACFVLTGLAEPNRVIRRARSFFSTIKVVDTAEQRSFIHGGVLHGRQFKDPRRRMEFPYQDQRGPLASAMTLFSGATQIGVVGLGAGGLAAIASAEQRLSFYEIDPIVYEVATEEFSFLRESKATLRYVFGDARLTLRSAPAGHFHVLLLDAFSGDGIPMHLLTREALDIYFEKLKPDGLLVFHISNNYVDLSRVLRGFSRETGNRVLVARYRPSPEERERGAVSVDAAAMSRSEETLRRLDAVPSWGSLPSSGPAVVWTDDRHDILGVMDWARLGLGD